MQTILIAGAGKSSIYLIEYILTYAPRNKWKVIIADSDAKNIAEKCAGNKFAEAVAIDITNDAQREALVKRADLVLSLMPPQLHILLAKDCLKHKKNLITSSYASDEMKAMDKAAKDAGLMFMCEMGLDPGIDHMTASRIIHSIHRAAGIITSFKSYCGGLIAPECDDNPWHYKFTWNPRNVVTAGADGAVYLSKGKEVSVPYDKMFDANKKIQVAGAGSYAYYPNRDSMKYVQQYDLHEINTFMRATLRHPVFCKGWHTLQLLGLLQQNDAFDTKGHTYASWLRKKAGISDTGNFLKQVAQKLDIAEDDKVMPMLQWLGLFDERPLPAGRYSSADVLLALLQDKWRMAPADKDMVIMQHEFEYTHREKKTRLTSTMVITGEGGEHTAMAKTVGLPMAILARFVITGKIKPPVGVVIPNMASVYRPVLTELAHYDIIFTEEVE
jgi:saccharopine dehydrogenase-like NADP-dependent oxidoreductase